MGRVVHFEITADDTARAQKFYEIFDWEIADAGMLGADYRLAKTGDTPVGIDGAIMPRAYKSQPSIIWISVDNIDEMVEKVKSAGGETAGEKQTVPGIGNTIYIKDTEGNIVGLLQALPRAPQED
jgi:predicted enzyme related to lactoylglutathione lyase